MKKITSTKRIFVARAGNFVLEICERWRWFHLKPYYFVGLHTRSCPRLVWTSIENSFWPTKYLYLSRRFIFYSKLKINYLNFSRRKIREVKKTIFCGPLNKLFCVFLIIVYFKSECCKLSNFLIYYNWYTYLIFDIFNIWSLKWKFKVILLEAHLAQIFSATINRYFQKLPLTFTIKISIFSQANIASFKQKYIFLALRSKL